MKNRSGRFGQKSGSLFGKTAQRAGLHRALRGESLEARHMMAGDVYLPYHNDLIPEDTNLDYSVTALDALMVINAINGGQLGELSGPGIGKADGPMFDVSGDNSLSPLDALKVINRINGEGEVGDLVGFSMKLADQNGNQLSQNKVSVGQTFQLQVFVQDLRGFDAQGIFGAYLDLDYTNGGKFQVQVGETQSFRYFFDKISTTDPSSSFKFTFGSETTAPVSLFNGTSPRSADQVAAAIQVALEALPSIGAGNVIVRRDPVASAQDSAANLRRNSFDIQFVNAKAGQNVPLLVLDASNVKVQTGQTFEFSLTDKYPADATNPESFASAFRFSDEFSSGRTATQGVSQFDEVGAFGGLSAPTNTTQPHLLFSVPLKAVESGTVTFTPSPADVFPAHETLVFPKEVVPTSLIEYGLPLTVDITTNLVANNNSFTVAEDAASAQFNITADDQLTNGTSFAITSVSSSTAGVTPTISADGKQVSYRPAPNFFGQDQFTYTITSNLGDTSTATVTMTVTAVNDPISVSNQTATTNLGEPVVRTTAELTAGGSVGAGEETIQQLSIASVVSPSAQGGVVSLSNGSVTYTPATGFAGTDTFVVVVTDNGQTNGLADPKTQSVTVTVTVINDAPVAGDDLTLSVDEDSADNVLDVLANDDAGANDVNDSLTITDVDAAQNGTVTISNDGKTLIYTPAIGFIGLDSFTYTVTDSAGATATATVNVEVEATVLPRARNDIASTTEDTVDGVVIDVLTNDRVTDPLLSQAVLLSVGAAANGTVTIEDNGTPGDATDDRVRYIPNANFSGTDTFTYVINETPSAGGLDSTGTVTVTVAAVNDAPVVVGEPASTSEDVAVTISATTLLSNDSPGPSEATQTLSITGVQAVTSGAGSVSLTGGNVVYTPAADFNGSFVFTYTATDNGSPALSGTATVTVTVNAVNDAPVAANDTLSAVEDTAKTIAAADLLNNDRTGRESATDELAGQSLTIVAVGSSANGGTVTLATGGASIAYTPALNFFGTDTFTYTVRDNGNPALESTATATINVGAVNDAPVAGANTVTAFKGVPLTIAGATLLSNDQPGPASESAQTLRITSVTGATNGSVVLQSNGDVVFTPIDDFTGAASFSYTVSDNGQTGGVDDFKTATATVAVDVKDFIPSRASGTLWVDDSLNRAIDAAERRLGQVEVTLTGTSFGQPVSRTVITDVDGNYEFGLLAPGSYTISYVTPALLTDGADVAGSLGDNDGQTNNNSFGFNITGIGGVDATGYNFAVNGLNSSYGTLLEQLASSYTAVNNLLANHGMYITLAADGTQSWFSALEGFKDVVFAEASISSTGREVLLTIVESDHEVYTAVVGRGKFIALPDNAGNTIIRILGGREQLQFTKVDMAAPTITGRHYLEAVDQFFDQEGI